MPSALLPRRLVAAAAITGILLVGACDDDDENGPTPGPDVAALVLSTAVTSDLTVEASGAVSGGPLDFDVGGHPVSVTVLDSDGMPIDPVDLDGYEVRVTGETPGVLTVSVNGPLAFTISALSGGMGSFTVALFGEDEDGNVFGPISVPVLVIGGGGA